MRTILQSAGTMFCKRLLGPSVSSTLPRTLQQKKCVAGGKRSHKKGVSGAVIDVNAPADMRTPTLANTTERASWQ